MSWNVECVRCGETIHAERRSGISTDVDGNPRHDDCPYALEPEYPVKMSIRTRPKYDVEDVITSNFPHLVPKLESVSNVGDIVPRKLLDIGKHNIKYKVYEGERKSLYDCEVSVASVDGEPVLTEIPKMEWECENCGTEITARAEYSEDSGYLPLFHSDCSGRDNPMFLPTGVSHLDSTCSTREEEVAALHERARWYHNKG